MATGARSPGEVPLVVRWRKAFLSDAGPESSPAITILLYLSTEMNRDGLKCWPGYGRIAKETRLDVRTVQRHVKALEGAGWVLVAKRKGRFGMTNQYFPAFPEGVSAQDRHPGEGESGEESGLYRGEGSPPSAGDRGVRDRGGSLSAEDPSPSVLSPSPSVLDPLTLGPVPPNLVVPGSIPGSDLGARARGEDRELGEGVEVPDDFDPSRYGLSDQRALFARLGPSGLLGHATRLLRRDGYEIPKGASVGRPTELDFLKPASLRELQFLAASRRATTPEASA